MPALPRWLTSKTPTAVRTASCSRSTPPFGYSMGISQPPKSAIFAPRSRCRESSGDRRSAGTSWVGPLVGSATVGDANAPPRYDRPGRGPDAPLASLGSADHPRRRSPVTTVRLATTDPATTKADVLVIG